MNLDLNNFEHEQEQEQVNEPLEKDVTLDDPKLSLDLRGLQKQLQDLKHELADFQQIKAERDRLLVSEQQLQNALQNRNSILESISDAFFSLDRQWCFTYLNTQAEKLFTKTRQQLIGHNIWEEFPQAVGSSFYRQYHHALVTGQTVEFADFYSPGNSWVEAHIYPSEQGLSIYLKNINHRKRTQQDLEEQRLKLNTILDSSTEGLYGLDMAGHCTFINRSALALFGYREEECLGKDMHQLIHYNYPDGTPYPSEK